MPDDLASVTLVPVHGFWSSPATWDELVAVWSADPAMRGMQIEPFGYPSPKRPTWPLSSTRIPDYDDIAQTLAGHYTVQLADAPVVAFVTHSQGGLILQRFLAWMLQQGRGRELDRVASIVMLACPNNGADYLRSLRHALGYRRHPQAGSLETLDRRVADTQRAVLRDIVNADGTDAHHCRIPVHVYAGDSDKVVLPASAQASFPRASTLPGSHSSILDPNLVGHQTAAAVRRHLKLDVAPYQGANTLASGGDEDVDTPRFLRGLPDGDITRELRAARDAEMRGRYGDALAAAKRALAASEALASDAPKVGVLVAVANAQVAAGLLRVDQDPEGGWLLAQAAADPVVLKDHPRQFFLALLTKAEAGLRTDRLAAAKAAIGAAETYADGPVDRRMLLQVSAMTSLAEHDHRTAITLYSQVADSFVRDEQTEPDPTLRARLRVGAASSLLNRGLAEQRSGDLVAAAESFQRSVDWYEEAGSPYDESVARRYLASVLFAQELWIDGYAETDAAVIKARETGFWVGEAAALELKGRAQATRDDVEGARGTLRAALVVLVDHSGSPRDRRRLVQMLATAESALGNADEANRLLDEAAELARDASDALAIADIDVQRQSTAGTKRSEIPAPDEVVAHLAQQVRTAERPGRAAMLSHKLAGAYRSRGELDPAERWYSRAHHTASSIGNRGLAAAALIGLAELALHNDNVSMAEQQLDRAATTADGIDDPELTASLKMFRARILAHRKDFRTAQQVLSEALNIAVSAHLDDLVDGIKEDLEKVNTFLSLLKPAMSLKELAAELYELESWYPEQQAALRSFWYYWRDTEILANLRAQSVSKGLFVAESASILRAMTESLGGLFDLEIFAPEGAFARNEHVNELVPFPADHPLPFCVNVVTVWEMQDHINQHLDGA